MTESEEFLDKALSEFKSAWHFLAATLKQEYFCELRMINKVRERDGGWRYLAGVYDRSDTYRTSGGALTVDAAIVQTVLEAQTPLVRVPRVSNAELLRRRMEPLPSVDPKSIRHSKTTPTLAELEALGITIEV